MQGIETFNPAPVVLETVLDPVWLSRALSCNGQTIEVESVDIVDQFGPSATKVRMNLGYSPEYPNELPASICLKGFFGEDAAKYLSSDAQWCETNFYRQCAKALPLRLPRCLYAGVDDKTRAGIILMEDLISAGARFLTALEPYSTQQAASSLDQLALLHAATSSENTFSRWPWVVSKLPMLSKLVPPPKLTELLKGEKGEGLPDSVRDGKRVCAALQALNDRDRNVTQCFVHGDAHAGNIFQTDQGAGIVDWQLLQRGHWSLDVAYHIAAVLDVHDRENAEQDLLRYYLERFASHGGMAPTWDEAWNHYRESIAYGYFLWGITLRVDPPIIKQFVYRLGSAVAAHDSLGRLGA